MALTKNVTYIDDWSDYIDANKKIVEEVEKEKAENTVTQTDVNNKIAKAISEVNAVSASDVSTYVKNAIDQYEIEDKADMIARGYTNSTEVLDIIKENVRDLLVDGYMELSRGDNTIFYLFDIPDISRRTGLDFSNKIKQ